MEFEFLIENGEFFVEDAEVKRLMEALELSEDEVMELVSAALSEGELNDAIDKMIANSPKNKERVASYRAQIEGGKKRAKTAESRKARYLAGMEGDKAQVERLQNGMKKQGVVKKAAKFVQEHPGKTAGIAAGALGVAAAGYGAKKLLDKRKAKKAADKEAKTVSECMIDLMQEGEYIYISESDMDFLLEAFDYELTEEEILTKIAEAKEVDECFPGDGIVAVTSDKYMSALPEKQEVDMPEKHCDNGMMADCSVAPDTKEKIKKPKCMHEDVDLLDEATELLEESEDLLDDVEDLLDESLEMALIDEDAVSRAEKKVAKAERKLKRAKDVRKAIDDVEKSKVRKGNETFGAGVGLGTGMANTSIARSVVRGRDRQDKRIEKAERKLKAAKEKLELKRMASKKVSESVQYNEYSESFEGDHLINEAILTDCNIQLTEDEMFDLISENLLSERSIVRLDKAAKRSQAEAKALIVIAREQNDPLYKKLVKCYKQKQAILNQLDSKYGSRAVARVRKNAGKMNVEK